MELIFVFLASAVLGLLTRYLMPRRLLTGAALIPTAVTATACVLWEGMLWEGMLWVGLVASNPLVSWLIALVGATVAGIALNIWLTRSRHAADQATLSRAA
jgi:hypothetical protein